MRVSLQTVLVQNLVFAGTAFSAFPFTNNINDGSCTDDPTVDCKNLKWLCGQSQTVSDLYESGGQNLENSWTSRENLVPGWSLNSGFHFKSCYWFHVISSNLPPHSCFHCPSTCDTCDKVSSSSCRNDQTSRYSEKTETLNFNMFCCLWLLFLSFQSFAACRSRLLQRYQNR